MLPGTNSEKSKPPYLKKYDVVRSKNIYILLIRHIFLQKSVFRIFKTTKTEVINKRKKHFAPAIRTKILHFIIHEHSTLLHNIPTQCLNFTGKI